MDQVLLCSSQIPLTTSISNTFIKKYMLNANGSYVKVYLYLSMCIQSDIHGLSISSLADRMENTEKDVLRALQYWEKKNLLTLQYNESNDDICGILLLNPETADQTISVTASDETPSNEISFDEPSSYTKPVSVPEDFQANTLSALKADTYTTSVDQTDSLSSMETATTEAVARKDDDAQPLPVDDTETKEIVITREQTERVAKDDDFSWTRLIVESYLDRPITTKEADLLIYLFDTLHFSKDLILYLYEYCCSIHKTNINYVQAVAFSWDKNNVKTPDDAQELSHQYNECHSAICKALGLNRMLGSIESQYIDRWQNEWQMDLAVILNACNRTILTIQKPDFKYLNGILENWHKHNVHTLQDVQVCDDNYNKKKANNTRDNKPAIQKSNNRNQFHAFEQRNTSAAEIDQLEKMLLKR